MSEAKDDLIARLLRWGIWLDSDLGTDEPAGDDCREAAARIASLTEQVEGLTREWDDALATISLLQSEYRKQQEHDTATIERLELELAAVEMVAAERLERERDEALTELAESQRGLTAISEEYRKRAVAAEAREKRLREALEWYAERANYKDRPNPYSENRRYPPKVILDDGVRARDALAATGEVI